MGKDVRVEKIGDATLYHADYRDIIDLFPPVDALITDVSFSTAGRFKIDFDEMRKLCPYAFIREAQRIHPPGEGRRYGMQQCYDYCVSLFPGARIVLDPCMGQAGIGMSALRAGKIYIGVEILSDRYDMALRKISAFYEDKKTKEQN